MKYYQWAGAVLGAMIWLAGCQRAEHPAQEFQTTVEMPTSEAVTEAAMAPATEQPTEAAAVTEAITESESGAAALPEVNESSPRPPSAGYYDYHNGIVIINEKDSILQISGLQNKQVEQSINNRIREVVQELGSLDLPPYRGIKKVTAGLDASEINYSIDEEVYYNEANILSLVISKWLYCGNRDNYASYKFLTSEEIPLTFDLRTGKELALADLFAEGYDYQTAIVDCVRDKASGSEQNHSYTLLQPFETIKETQKFFITSSDTIELVLDFDTPEFDVGTDEAHLAIESVDLPEGGKEFVFTEKYETWDESLYQTGRKCSLRPDWVRQRTVWQSTHPQMAKRVEDDYYQEEGLYFRTTTVTNIENQALAGEIAGIAGRAEERMMELFQEYQVVLERTVGAAYFFDTSKYGTYLNVSEEYESWGAEYAFSDKTRVYNTVTGQQMSLWDCFVQGEAYKETLISLFPEWVTEDFTRQEIEEYFVDPDFSIYNDGMYLDVNTHGDWYGVHISFEEIGEENQTLFD